jgi:hypothetical protein
LFWDKGFQPPLTDSVILAAAQMHAATVWTQNIDFEGIEGVQFISKG